MCVRVLIAKLTHFSSVHVQEETWVLMRSAPVAWYIVTHQEIIEHVRMMVSLFQGNLEGNLDVKPTTVWRDGKARAGKSQGREEKK